MHINTFSVTCFYTFVLVNIFFASKNGILENCPNFVFWVVMPVFSLFVYWQVVQVCSFNWCYYVTLVWQICCTWLKHSIQICQRWDYENVVINDRMFIEQPILDAKFSYINIKVLTYFSLSELQPKILLFELQRI